MRKTLAALGVLGLVALVACSSADPYGDRPTLPDTVEGKSATQSCTASKPLPGVDPSGFTQCKGTKGTSGRCIPSAVLGEYSDKFEQASCASDQSCVPDEVIKSGSNLQLKKCTGVLKTEGRCFWPLAKDIIANYDMLKGSSGDCTDGMVCAPCTNPITKQVTGVCNTGGAACADSAASTKAGGGAGGGTCPQVEPIFDASSFQAEDCGSGMLCVDAGLVPAEQGKLLKTCSKGKCAPKKSVERAGNYVPKSCRSQGNSEGRCVNMNIPAIAEQASLLPQAGCDADERCAPCFDPRTGADTGACKQASCDAPKEPAKTFAACCASRGRCVPESAVEGAASLVLQQDTCSGDTPICAPSEFVGVTPPRKCRILGFVEGRCISGCTSKLGDLVQGDCPNGDMCTACSLLPDGTCK